MPYILLIASMAWAEPPDLPCCEGTSARAALAAYLKVRKELLQDGVWSGALTRWAAVTRRPTGNLSQAEQAVYKALYSDIWRLYGTHSKAPVVAEFSTLSRRMTFLVLSKPGGARLVGEATCGEQYWLQPTNEPLTPLVEDGCTPAWVMP